MNALLLRELLAVILISSGLFFFLSASVGLVRFPDALSRLHALTKSDNLGLGFIVFGLGVYAGSVAILLKLILIWLVSMVAGSVACFLLGRSTLQEPQQKKPRQEQG